MNKTPLLAALALSIAAIGAPMSAQAHDQTIPAIAQGSTLLTVSADGRSTRAPDLALFSAGVTTQGKTAGEALAANSTDMARVIAALKKAGIADKDIQTSNLNLNPIYSQPRQLPDGSYSNEPPRIVGYQVNNTVSVRQRKLADFGKVIDTLVSSGANQVSGPSFMLDQPDAALDEARSAAMTKARARAELYARAAGLRVARIVSISEAGGYAPPMPVMYKTAMDAASPVPPPPPIAPGEVENAISVTVQFELAP